MSRFIKNLRIEDREDLMELLRMRSMTHLLEWLDQTAEEEARKVLTYDLSTGSDRELAITKARSEGARNLAKLFRMYIQKVKSDKI